MRKVRAIVLLMFWGWMVLGLGERVWAFSEMAELKRVLQQVREENRRLSERISELERRLAEYEGTEKPGKEESWMQLTLTAAFLGQGLLGVNKRLANIHAHGGREPQGQSDMVMRDENKSYAALALDLAFSAEFSEGDQAYALLEMGSGKNPESEVPSFSGIVDEALSMVPVETDEGEVRISEAWYEKRWPLGTGELRLRIGKVDVTTEVDQNRYANDENMQFMSPAFVNNPAVEWASYGLGIIVSYETDTWTLTLGYEDADSSWEEIFDYPFGVAQLAISSSWGGRKGNYRFYVWYQGEKHLSWGELEDYFAGKTLRPKNEDPAWGFGFSWDQEIKEGLGFFLRYGYRGDDLVGYAAYDDTGAFDLSSTDFSSGFEHAITAGLSLSGKFWGRERDEMGIGLAIFLLNEEYEKYWEAREEYRRRLTLDSQERRLETEDEYHFELYYRLQATESFSLTLDWQYTRNPAGLKDSGFWVLALRGVWNYGKP